MAQLFISTRCSSAVFKVAQKFGKQDPHLPVSWDDLFPSQKKARSTYNAFMFFMLTHIAAVNRTSPAKRVLASIASALHCGGGVSRNGIETLHQLGVVPSLRYIDGRTADLD